MLEAKASLTEVDLAGNLRIHHPLQGPVDGRSTDLLVFLLDEVDQIVRAEMPLLAKEDIED